MSAQAIQKFTFDLDLGAPEEKKQSLSEETIARIRDQAHAEGVAKGRVEGEQLAMQRTEAAFAAAAEKIAGNGVDLLARLQDAQNSLHAQSVAFAHAVAVKIARGLIETKPARELETLIAENLSTLNTAPHLVVRCHPDLVEQLKQIVEARAVTAGFTGRLIVMGDPEIALGDGRMEWADGGIVRDTAAIEREVGALIDAYLARNGLERPSFSLEQEQAAIDTTPAAESATQAPAGETDPHTPPAQDGLTENSDE